MPVALALTEELDIYTPCITNQGNKQEAKLFERMLFLVKVTLTITSRHFTKPQQEKVISALRFSAKHHAGIRRKDGVTPYFMHPLEIVYLLHQMEVYDFKIMVAAILHDVVEDTKVTLKEIARNFGSAIRNIVDLITKHPDSIRKWRYWSLMKEEPDLNCRWRVIVLKFLDRIHNMMTLWALQEEDQKRKLQETVQEFPSLYKVLVRTFIKLHKKGTLKKRNPNLPFRLNNRLYYEMGRYESLLPH